MLAAIAIYSLFSFGKCSETSSKRGEAKQSFHTCVGGRVSFSHPFVPTSPSRTREVMRADLNKMREEVVKFQTEMRASQVVRSPLPYILQSGPS